MNIEQLTESIKQKLKEGYTDEERALLLYDAKIVDDSGNYHHAYFRAKTISKGKKNGPIVDPKFLTKCLQKREKQCNH